MTRYNDFKINDITIMQKTMLLWDNAHYTQNDNHALSSWCLKKGGDNIKVKEWLCARAFYFENMEAILSTVVVLHMCHA